MMDCPADISSFSVSVEPGRDELFFNFTYAVVMPRPKNSKFKFFKFLIERIEHVLRRIDQGIDQGIDPLDHVILYLDSQLY
jgi:hypothetical protein